MVMKTWVLAGGLAWLAATGAQGGGLTTATEVPIPTQWSQPQVLPNGKILPAMPTHFATQTAGVSYQAGGTGAGPAGGVLETNALALLAAAERGDTNTIKALLARQVNIESATPTGATALILAAMRGQLGAVAVLLAGGADINAATSDGKTALVVAVINGHTAVAKLLLDGKADASVMDEAGKMAVDYARAGQKPEMLELFKTPGAPAPIPRPGTPQ